MAHSFLLLNDGSNLGLNDGSSLLLNEAGPEHDEGSSGGGIFRRFRRTLYKQEQQQQLTIQDFSRLITSRPFLLQDFVRAILLIPQVHKNLNLLSAAIKSTPTAIKHLLLQAIRIEQTDSFTINEPASQWIKSGLDNEDREKSFEHSSSFIGEVIYTAESQTMTIILNGKLYGFCNISERIFDSFKGAASKGAYFSRNISEQFDC